EVEAASGGSGLLPSLAAPLARGCSPVGEKNRRSSRWTVEWSRGKGFPRACNGRSNLELIRRSRKSFRASSGPRYRPRHQGHAARDRFSFEQTLLARKDSRCPYRRGNPGRSSAIDSPSTGTTRVALEDPVQG